MKGTINDAKVVGQGETDGKHWTRYSVTIDGTAYTCFEDFHVQPGDLVEYETIQKGKFVNLKSVKKVELPPPLPPANGYKGKPPEESASIARAVALKAGVEFGRLVLDIYLKGDSLITDSDLLAKIEAARDRWYAWLMQKSSGSKEDEQMPF